MKTFNNFLITILTLGFITAASASYNPKEVICNHDMDKMLQYDIEFKQAMLDNDKIRIDSLVAVIDETAASIKEDCGQ